MGRFGPDRTSFFPFLPLDTFFNPLHLVKVGSGGRRLAAGPWSALSLAFSVEFAFGGC